MYVQNLPSIVVPHILAPLPTDSILDMCASPGALPTSLFSTMSNAYLMTCDAVMCVILRWESHALCDAHG
eukprot:3263059-Rhodomonas_salina.5